MSAPSLHELVAIDVESGVSESTREGFVILRAHASDGTVIYGQTDPATARELAGNYLAAAEAAESDAAVLAELTEGLGLPIKAAAAFVAALRNRRNP